MSNKYQEIMDTIEKQEKMLAIDSFSSEFALELGNFMAKLQKERGLAFGVCIRKIDGAILFQYLPTGPNTVNAQNWLRRKANMVIAWEHSSLYMWAREQLTGQTVQYNGLDPNEYVQRGGGFPLFLKSGEFIGAISATGMAHNEDHQFIVDSLSLFLGVEGVPEAVID